MQPEGFIEFQSTEVPEGVSTTLTLRRARIDGTIELWKKNLPYTGEEMRRIKEAHEQALKFYGSDTPLPWNHELQNRANTITRIRDLLEWWKPQYNAFMMDRQWGELPEDKRAFNLMFVALAPFGEQKQPE